MAPDQANFRPSEAVPPRPKRRKVGYLATDGSQSAGPSRTPQSSRREWSQFGKGTPNERGLTASVNTNAPHRSAVGLANRIPTMHAKASPVLVHRVRSTPARPPTRIVPENIGFPNVVNPRFSLVKEYSSPPIHPSQKLIGRIAEGRLKKNIKPKNEKARSIEKVGFVTSNDGYDTDGTDSPDSPDEILERMHRRITHIARLPPRGHRAARKTKIQVASMSERRAEPSQLYQSPSTGSDFPPNQAAVGDHEDEDDLYINYGPEEDLQPVQGLPDSDTDSSSSESSEDKLGNLKQEMLKSLNVMTTREARLSLGGRLPFMRRNIRKVMDSFGAQRQRKQYLRDSQLDNPQKVSVNFVFEGVEFQRGEFAGSWYCPLCITEVYFNLRAALSLHLSWYHSQCQFGWKEAEDDTLILNIALPDDPVSGSDSEDDIDDDWSESEFDSEMPMDELSFTRRSPTPEVKPFLRGSSVAMVQNASSSSPIKVQLESPSLSPIKSPEPKRQEVLRPPRPIHPEDPLRYPTPPPYSNLEGPSAVYPYISEGQYSARIGGPYLYDILNELPTEPFGMMEWQIIDKEEEIFEQDHVRDEDKVMRALWSRWTRLNKNNFIADYKNGVLMFIDEYWRYIHRAAGFAALRKLLISISDYRFLDDEQYCYVINHYRDLVGMDQWL